MKKNLIYAGMLLLGMIVATSCSNEESLEQVANNGKTIQAVIEKVDARTSVSDNYEVLWTANDQFDVWDETSKVGTLVLQSGEGTTSGSFGLAGESFEVADGMTAFYPSNTNDEKAYTFADSYTSQITNAPMAGTFANGKFTFSLLTAMVRVVVTDVPEGNATLTITAGDNVKLTGKAGLGDEGLALPDGTNAVTVTVNNATAGSTLTFDVPVPVQTYTSGLNVKLEVAGAEVFNKTTNGFTAEVGKIYVFGAKTVSIDTTEDLTSTIQDLLDGGYSVVLEGEAEEVSVSSLSLPVNTTATLDLNGKTLNLGGTSAAMAKSASGTNGIVNKGTLVITGGKIVYASESINMSAIYNAGNITLTDVEIESNARCFVNKGTWNSGYTSLAQHGTTPSVVATITDCEFTSSLNDHLTEGKHIYAVHGEFYSKMVMKNTIVSGHGGISVDCSSAEMEKVTATHNCTTGAHDLYVACGNATFDNQCVFENAYAYSGDNVYGNAVVNNKEFTASGVIAKYTSVSDAEGLKTAVAAGNDVALTAAITLTEKLSVEKDITLDLNGQTLTIQTDVAYGLISKGKMTIMNGTIVFEGDNTNNGAAVCNMGQITLSNVDITSNSVCFRNYGETKNSLTDLQATGATVTAVINGGAFTSSYNKSESHTQHRYAVHAYMYSNLTMTGCTVSGSGGVSVDVSFATLNDVKATHVCQYGAHDLYVACGNATVNDCTFANAYAYSDTTYGNAVVNGKEYTTSGVITE